MTDFTDTRSDPDTETGTPEDPPRPGLRIHPRETWDRARDDYLAGLSGPAVCARYGLGLAAFRKRAATEGWRRIDQPQPLPVMPIEIDGDLEEAGYFDLAEMSAIHMREAIVNGRVRDAEAWLRMHLRLHVVAGEEFAVREALRDDEPEAVDEVDEVDGIDGIFPAPESTFSPGTRPRPETPALLPSSPVPAPGCDAETDRSG